MLSDWLDAPIEVIPAVDVLGEGAVRLHQGDYDAVVERVEEPAALARWLARNSMMRGGRGSAFESSANLTKELAIASFLCVSSRPKISA